MLLPCFRAHPIISKCKHKAGTVSSPSAQGANADPLNVLIATLIKKMREKFQASRL